MNAQLERMEKDVSRWPNISVHPHRFAAREFRFGKAEVGHVHTGGIVDIPFPRPIRDALLDEVLQKNISGFPTLGGLPSAFAQNRTSNMRYGCCACPTCDTR